MMRNRHADVLTSRPKDQPTLSDFWLDLVWFLAAIALLSACGIVWMLGHGFPIANVGGAAGAWRSGGSA